MNSEFIKQEIISLHAFFTDWYNGVIESDELNTIFDQFDDDFTITFPDGSVHSKSDLLSLLKADYGSDENHLIEIRDISIEPASDGYFNASYQEWQYSRGDDTPYLKLQTEAVLMTQGGSLKWVSIFEQVIV